jgi:hypothetical protein
MTCPELYCAVVDDSQEATAIRRPPSVTALGWLFVAVGVFSLGRQLVTFAGGRPALVTSLPGDFWYAAVSAAAVLIAGAFILKGARWARWLLAAWLLFHVALGLVHGPVTIVVHTVLAAVVLWLLYRRQAAGWFHRH